VCVMRFRERLILRLERKQKKLEIETRGLEAEIKAWRKELERNR
jgi:hypothetical protein